MQQIQILLFEILRFFFSLNIFGPSSAESMDIELADTECCRYRVLIMFCFWLKFFFVLWWGRGYDWQKPNSDQKKRREKKCYWSIHIIQSWGYSWVSEIPGTREGFHNMSLSTFWLPLHSCQYFSGFPKLISNLKIPGKVLIVQVVTGTFPQLC